MDRVLPAQRNVTRAIRPLLARVVNMPLAGDEVFDAVRDFYARLDGVRELLTDGAVTSARLVVNPERMVVAEARRTYTYLSLFGYHVDAVVANRLLPDRGRPTRGSRVGRRSRPSTSRRSKPASRRCRCSPRSSRPKSCSGRTDSTRSPRRSTAWRTLPTGCPTREPFRVDAEGDALVLSLHLPFTERDDVELGRSDGELFVAVGPHRRAIVLPDSLVRREVGAARLDGDRLVVEFVEV